MRKGLHPNSLANLVKGRQKWSATRPRGEFLAPEVRRRICSAGARSRAAKYLTKMERDVLREYGQDGLACFRRGRRIGYNVAYLRWKDWAYNAFYAAKRPA